MRPDPPPKKPCHWCSKLIGRDVPVAVNTATGKRYFHKNCVKPFLDKNPNLRAQMEQNILQRYR